MQSKTGRSLSVLIFSKGNRDMAQTEAKLDGLPTSTSSISPSQKKQRKRRRISEGQSVGFFLRR